MKTEFQKDLLRVLIFKSRSEMGKTAGKQAAEKIRNIIRNKGIANVMFAAAPSQNETLAELCEADIDWSKVNAFHMDEYVGLDEHHPAGFRLFLKRALFDRFPFRTINLLDGNAPDPEIEAERYGALLTENPLDVCLLGIGENGHIAFNDPPVADFHDSKKVKIVELEHRCRQQQVHDKCFDTIEQVPTHALTVTIPVLMSAGSLICSVPAETKADAVRHLLQDEISVACPATIMRTHPDACLYLDPDSSSQLS